MLQRREDVFEVFPHGLGAAGQVDDEGLAPQHAGPPAQHPARGDAEAVIPHGLGNAGGVAGSHGIGRFRGDIPGRKARAAAGQDQIQLPPIGQPDELGLEGRFVVGQQQGLFHAVARLLQHLCRQRAALVHPLAPGPLIREGDDGGPQGRVFHRGQQGHLVADMHHALLQHPGKHALPGHDAVAGLLADDAVVVALLADLGQLQHCPAHGQAAAHGQGAEIEALHHKVFAKGSVFHPDLLAEVFDLLGAQQADLSVPVSAVGVALHPPAHGELCLGLGGLDGAPGGAGADGQNFAHSYPPMRYIPCVRGEFSLSK